MIERIRLRNFRRYRDATLQFQAGVNFIEGLNNVGKTSLFYATEYALFGRVEGFKSIRALVHPGKRSMGVEMIFAGRTGERYLLQRAHIMPARSRKTMDGHFTLKALSDEGERYVLASDFGDTEDKLSLKLRELLGLNRRLFSVALHMRQGDIAAILDGAKQLDIVLGVTAAAMADEEMRQLALELEKESAALPVLQERLKAIGNELTQVGGSLATLQGERKTTVGKLNALGEAAPPVEMDRRLAPLLEAIDACTERQRERDLAGQRLADEEERWGEVVRGGSAEALQQEQTKLDTDAQTRTKAMKKLRADLEKVTAEQRRLDEQCGDLTGRIARRQSLPSGENATCEVCGVAIDATHVAEELAKWSAELERLEGKRTETRQRQTQIQTELDREDGAERQTAARLGQIKDQREKLTKVEAARARRTKERDTATEAATAAFTAVTREATRIAGVLKTELALEATWKLDGEPPAVIASIRQGIQTLRQALAEKVGRQTAERQALTDLLQRFDTQNQGLVSRQTALEREQATATAEATNMRTKATQAARYRTLSAAFKELQASIRAAAATQLATDTLRLHRQLSERDEFESLTIEPTSYAVQVVPRDLGEEVPAALYEGGGHRLLLGLAFRLAVARLVQYCPFLLLDEPTYGLDAAHREALLNRIASLDISRQILLVTHQAMGDVAGHRIRVVRKDKETVVAE